MRPKLKVLRVSGGIYEQLRIEEALLRADTGNWCVIGTHSPPAIVLGISGKVNELINLDRWHQHPIPLIRRFSGGGTVVVDQDTLFISIIANSNDSGVRCQPDTVLHYNGALYEKVLAPHGFAVTAQDYTLGAKKIAGNAQYLRRGRWLHHTSWLWDYSEEWMEYLLIPQRQPEYRAMRSHGEFLCRLRKVLAEPEMLIEGVLDELRRQYEVSVVAIDEVTAVLGRDHRKSLEMVELGLES